MDLGTQREGLPGDVRVARAEMDLRYRGRRRRTEGYRFECRDARVVRVVAAVYGKEVIVSGRHWRLCKRSGIHGSANEGECARVSTLLDISAPWPGNSIVLPELER